MEIDICCGCWVEPAVGVGEVKVVFWGIKGKEVMAPAMRRAKVIARIGATKIFVFVAFNL